MSEYRLPPDENIDVEKILEDLEHYRPRRRGWTWRKPAPELCKTLIAPRRPFARMGSRPWSGSPAHPRAAKQVDVRPRGRFRAAAEATPLAP